MKFNYKARTKQGELQVGNVEAASRDAAVAILLSHELYVLSLEPMKEQGWWTRITDFFERVKGTDLMIFTRQFATLIASQVPIGDSLRSLYEQATKPVLKEVIAEVASDIESGFSLSQALSRHPGVFNEFYVNMVKSAEVTGRLSEVLDFLADYLEKQSILIGKLRNALVYPAFVIGLFIVVVVIMVTMVLPQIAPVFTEVNVELPTFTKILLFSGTLVSEWWWAILIAVGILAALAIDYLQTAEGRVVMNEVSLRLPLVGSLLQKVYIARFAESARVLIKGGLTIPQAIEISSHTIGNYVYEDVLHEVAQAIRKGLLLSQALKGAPYFPPLVAQLVAVGESTGRLETMLERVSSFYNRQVDDTVSNLVELIQPALLVVIGLMVAGLFAAILLPLYNLTKSF
ncbi:MAG: type II secretion system F family protein [Candidatus Brennerbacteria bacterium]|nr:type II secretion system F family protein [Candidatus Brennerbacteria bacterium]